LHTTSDVKTAYRDLCKLYHPDKPTGNAAIFDRLTIFYKSLVETF
jgi:curved DNA-binding protein CbpA